MVYNFVNLPVISSLWVFSMTKYRTEIYEDVHNPQYSFRKLYIDGRCQFDEFLEHIARNKNDMKLYRYIISYMDSLTDQIRFPASKFNHIEAKERSDIFEFKKDRLRVYVIKQKPDVFIVIGGYKGRQEKDINRLKNLIKEFPIR